MGVTYEPENASALAGSIAGLVGDPERRVEMARNAMAAVRRYNRAELAAAMLKTLERVSAGSMAPTAPATTEVTAT